MNKSVLILLIGLSLLLQGYMSFAQPKQKGTVPSGPTEKRAQRDEDKQHEKDKEAMQKQTKEFQTKKRHGNIPKSKA